MLSKEKPILDKSGKHYKLDNAPGYQDRNWGNSFPEWWTWIAANHFENYSDTVLAIGGGRPELLNSLSIEGVEVGLKHKGKVYSFRPNNFDNVKININFGTWEVVASDGDFRVEVSAWAPLDDFIDLQFLTPTGEVFHDYETLTGELTVKLYRRSTFKWELMETLYSEYAGIEFGSRDVRLSDLVCRKNFVLYESR
jgi:hypothetical protein